MISATITDVARHAGVSIKTVSRVLNREPNVRLETRERVEAAVAALDYRPSQSARSLAGARSYLIGLLFDNPSAAYLSDVQFGAVDRCRASGRHLVIEPVDSTASDLPALIRQSCLGLRPDGMIVTPPICDDVRVLDCLEGLAIPYVRLGPRALEARGPQIVLDDRAASAAMTRHLIAQGHRDIGFILGHPDHGASERRRRGFVDAMAEAGLSVPEHRVARGLFSFDSGMRAAEILLQTDRPTAIFASNDDMALGVMAAAQRAGLRTPQDLSVAGFDDTQAARAAWPPLTTVSQPITLMSAAAADMLIAGDATGPFVDGPPVRTFDFSIQTRGSVAPPAG